MFKSLDTDRATVKVSNSRENEHSFCPQKGYQLLGKQTSKLKIEIDAGEEWIMGC